MKKWLVAIGVVLMLAVVSVYVFIPPTLIVSKVKLIACSRDAAYRILSDENTWGKWWRRDASLLPAKLGTGVFVYNGYDFRLTKRLYSSLEVSIGHNGSFERSGIELIPIRRDSVAAEWQCNITASRNPLKRVRQYMEAIAIKNNMTVALDSLGAFLQVNTNVYGMGIIETSTTDTLLMETKSLLSAYPSDSDVYRLVDVLKNYIRAAHAKVTGSPLVNVTQLSKSQFELKVAIPTDRELKGNNAIFFRQMIPGNFLVAVVRGGQKTVAEAQTQMQHFMDDHQKTSMAIPFEVFVTDRMVETDTAKWVTKLYEPVFK